MTVTHTEPPGVCADCGGRCQPHHKTCLRCHTARAAVSAAEHAERASAERRLALAKAWSPFRCRDHHDVIVNAKGKGCPLCEVSRKRRAVA